MKWGKYPEKVVERFTAKVFGGKGIYILLALGLFLLLSGASHKWGL